LTLAGRPFDVQPEGIVVAKHSALRKAVLDGLKVLISNGKYAAILTKWGLRSGAIRHPKINGANTSEHGRGPRAAIYFFLPRPTLRAADGIYRPRSRWPQAVSLPD
jgi:hypothetical protein